MRNSLKKEFTYSAFGLVISSEIELPEFMVCQGDADVRIILDKAPDNIIGYDKGAKRLQISDNEFLLIRKRVKLYISNGNLIIIEAREKAKKEVIKTYLTGLCMVVILLQRGLIPVHGSSVMINDHGVIFTGESGAGKTSLCYYFRKRGYKFLSDDISVVTLDNNGIPYVNPAFPQQKFCKNTARTLGLSKKKPSEGFIENKYVLNSDRHFRNNPVPLAAIFEISKENIKKVNSIELKGTKKLKGLLNNICHTNILHKMGIKSDYFLKCTDIINKVDYHCLIRPEKGNSTEDQLRRVVETMEMISGKVNNEA